MFRKTAVAGHFYPADKKVLESELQQLVPPAADRQKVLGLLAPHAGYVYSGGCAGQGYGRAALTETVIILGVNHRGVGGGAGRGRERLLGDAHGQRRGEFRAALAPAGRLQAVPPGQRSRPPGAFPGGAGAVHPVCQPGVAHPAHRRRRPPPGRPAGRRRGDRPPVRRQPRA